MVGSTDADGSVTLERLRLFGSRFALSWAVTAGDVIYVTGMTGMVVDFEAPEFPGFTYPDGHEAQMRQCYRNIGWILGRVGSSLRDIADQTIFYVGDPNAIAAASKLVRGELFGVHGEPPAKPGGPPDRSLRKAQAAVPWNRTPDPCGPARRSDRLRGAARPAGRAPGGSFAPDGPG